MTAAVTAGTWGVRSWARLHVVLGVVAAVAGVLVQRPDLAVLGAPLLLHAGWASATRAPAGDVHVDVRSGDQAAEGGGVAGTVALSTPTGTDVVHLRASSPGTRPTEALVAAARDRELTVRTRTARTGEHELFRIDARALGADASRVSHPLTAGPVRLLVLPRSLPLRVAPLPDRLQGLTGTHSARRAGEGGEFHDVHPFTPGDRLRRVDWRTTARRSAATGGQLRELYVRRTYATADATVMLVIDSRDELGPDASTWAGAGEVRIDDATSLDLARQAAASLARYYLRGGDRVGLEDLGRRRRPVPPSGGGRQLERIVRRLALARPDRRLGTRRRAPHLPSGALVVVLSTFLDADAAHLAHLWRRSGHRVLAVDVLPHVPEDQLDDRVRTAYRLVRIERQDRLAALQRADVEVVPWRSQDAAGPAGARLAALTRARHRPGYARGRR